MNTQPLYLATRFIFVIKIIMYLFMLAFTITLVYSMINSAAFSDITIENSFKARLTIGDFSRCKSCAGPEKLTLAGLSFGMKLWLLIRSLVLMGLTLISLHVLSGIIRTIRSKSTFYSSNIQGFMRLFRLGMLLAFFGCFNFFIQGGTSDFEFSIPFGALGYSLGCWLLAEIFREGKALSDESKSII